MKHKLLVIAMLLVFIGCATADKQPIAAIENGVIQPATGTQSDWEKERDEANAYFRNRKIALRYWDWFTDFDWIFEGFLYSLIWETIDPKK